MTHWLSFFFVSLSAIFVVVDPIATAPVFASMTGNRSRDDVRRIVRRATWVGALLLASFTLFGGLLFKVLRVELSAFRIAGGLLLLLTAIDMLRAKMSACKCTPKEVAEGAHKEDIAVVPLATPLLAGPGSMATVMVLMSDGGGMLAAVPVLISIALTFGATYFILLGANRLTRYISSSALSVVQRVMGLVLAAVAIQFIVDGSRQLLGRGLTP